MAHAQRNSRGVTYYLHGKTVTLQNGRPMPVYYFNQRLKPAEALDRVPAGYVVEEKAGSGLPYLKRATS